MDAYATYIGWDLYKPLRDFENFFSGYSSQRANVESLVNTWEQSDQSDPTSFPEANFIIDDEVTQTLINTNNQVKIEGVGTIVNNCDGPCEITKKKGACTGSHTNFTADHKVNAVYDTIASGVRVWKKIKIDEVGENANVFGSQYGTWWFVNARVTAKVRVEKKRWWGGWTHTRRELDVRAVGQVHVNNVAQLFDSGWQSNGPKKRFHRKTHSIFSTAVTGRRCEIEGQYKVEGNHHSEWLD